MNNNNKKDFIEFLNDKEFCEWVMGHKPNLTAHYKKLIKNHPEKSEEFYEAINILNSIKEDSVLLPYSRKAEIWETILDKYKKQNKPKRKIYRLIPYAAALLFAVLISGSIYYLFTYDKYEAFLTEAPQNDLSETTLILNNGEIVAVKSDDSKITYDHNGTTVEIDGKEQHRQKKAETASINQLTVPYGKKSNIILSDSTEVWLNAGSRLVYPVIFEKKNRTVFLEGEGFFEVTKNKDKPFIVKTNKLEVKVLGTSFLVKAFPEENTEEAVVVTGLVSLNMRNQLFDEDIYVKPNQRAILSKEDNQYKIQEVNVQDYTSWIEGMFIFNEEPLQNVLLKVSRFYNLDISWEKDIEYKKVSGKLDLNDDFEKVLDALSLISGGKYINENNKIHFELK